MHWTLAGQRLSSISRTGVTRRPPNRAVRPIATLATPSSGAGPAPVVAQPGKSRKTRAAAVFLIAASRSMRRGTAGVGRAALEDEALVAIAALDIALLV